MDTSKPTTLEAKNGELFKLLLPHRTTPIMQRVNLYVQNKTGKRLPDFISNGAALEAKIALLDELIAILKQGAFDQLPEAPAGQAQAAPLTPKPTAAPSAALVKGYTKFQPDSVPSVLNSDLHPADAAGTSCAGEVETRVGIASSPEPSEKLNPAAPIPDTPAGLAAQIGALLAKAMQPSVPATPAFSEHDIRRLVRQELALVLTTMASVLAAPPAVKS